MNGPFLNTLGPGSHVAQTGVLPVTEVSCENTRRVGLLVGQDCGTGPTVGMGGTDVEVAVGTFIGDFVLAAIVCCG